MPTWPLITGIAAGQEAGLAGVRYDAVGGYLSGTGTEADAQVLLRDTYTLANLYVRVIANAATGAVSVLSRKNGANGNQSVSIPALTTGVFQDAVNTDALVTGDLIDTLLPATADGNITYSVIGYTLQAAANTTPILITKYTDAGSLNHDSTGYSALGGQTIFESEANCQYTFRVAATLSNFRCYFFQNNVAGTSTSRTRKNGGNGAQSVSIPASTTGAFEDAANSDSIVAGDTVDYQLVAGGPTGWMTWCEIQLKSNSAGRQVTAAEAGSILTLASGLTRYVTPEGTCQSYATTEADAQIALAAFAAKNMFVLIRANSLNGATTIRIRKASANSALSVSVPAATTGVFEDTANTDAFLAANALDSSIVTGGDAGTITPSYIGFELQQAAAAAKAKTGFVVLQ